MAVSTQSFSQIVANAVAQVQGAASALVDFTVGSISLALMQAAAGMSLWLQGIALQIAALTRFATSTGTDADSWGADFYFYRLGAVFAQGTVTFSRYTASQQALVPAATQTGTTSTGLPIWSGGTVVQTADGTEQYQVIPDTTQSAYNSTLNAYVLPASTMSVNATVQALVAGTGGNVAANTITVIGQSIVGVDTVNNASAFTNGEPEELDSAYKARFPAYIASLRQATLTACIDAVENLQEGAACYITENYNLSGYFQASYFYAICDDGTGHPSSTFLSNCYSAIDAVRAIGTTFGVFAPTLLTANVSMVVTALPGFNATTVEGAVVTALTTYINTLPVGATLYWSRLIAVAYGVTGVQDVTNVLLNSATNDLTPTGGELIKIGTCTVT